MTNFTIKIGLSICILLMLVMVISVLIFRRPTATVITVITDSTYQLIDIDSHVVLTRRLDYPNLQAAIVLPDGQHIMVMVGESTQRSSFIVFNIETGASFSPANEFNLSSFRWRLDGDQLAIYARPVSNINNYEEFVIDLTEQAIRRADSFSFELTNFQDTSPDGRWQVSKSVREGTRMTDTQTGTTYSLSDRLPADISVSTITWSQDSTRIAFDVYEETRSENRGVYVASPNGDTLQHLVDLGFFPLISPDGRFVTVRMWQAGGLEIFDLMATTSLIINDAQQPLWSPLSNYMAYIKEERLYVQRPNEDNRRYLAKNVDSFAYWR